MRIVEFVLAFFMLSAASFAQQVKDVCGSYTYYPPETVSKVEAREIAVQRARIETLGDVFGRNIQSIATTSKNASDADFSFSMIAEDQVKGEWLSDIRDPEISYKYDLKGNLAVTATVYGKAREIPAGRANIEVEVLCNGTGHRFASESFVDGDSMYLRFLSPVDGYVAVYLVDCYGTAYCLLPYRGQEMSNYRITAGEEYVFFSEDKAKLHEFGKVDEYELTCDNGIEFNNLYVVFSPNKFYKGVDVQSDDLSLPREMDKTSFSKWLFKIRMNDNELIVNNKPITIYPKPDK